MAVKTIRKVQTKKFCGSIRFFSLAILLLILFSLLTYPLSASSRTMLDLANYSERYLSDFALSEGGYLTLDTEGNIVFKVRSASNSLRFKCTGAYSTGEQNAICIKMINSTGSSKVSVEVVFMNLDNELITETYEKSVLSAGNDSYIFIQSPTDLFVTSVTLKATGVGAGSITVMGIWHCYYYFTEEDTDTPAGVINRLEYLNGGAQVAVEGSIHHDITIASKNSSIKLYRLLPGETISKQFIEEHKPCAESLMSRSFSFVVDNLTGDDYASAYAMVILANNGEIEHVIEDRRYPTVPDSGRSEETFFKGVASSLESFAARTYADTLVIDVYTDKVISHRLNGYLYSFCGESYCFDSEAINSIDRRITSVPLGKSNVFFRLSLEGDGTPATVYDADGEKAKELYALISFLCERYSDNVGGIIAGRKFDIPHTYKELSDVKYADYLRKYSDYLSIISAALRNCTNGARTVVPLSSNNSRIYGESESEEKYPMSAMLISLVELYSNINSSSLTLMVCDDTFPTVSDISSKLTGTHPTDGDTDGDFRAQSGEIMNITSENTATLEKLISFLTEKFDFVDERYFFAWEPSGAHTHAEYEIAYSYTYFNLCANENIYSFVCDFTDSEKQGNYDKSEHMADVIAAMGGKYALSYADRLTKEAGDFTFSGIKGYDSYATKNVTEINISASSSAPDDSKGTFPLSDLSIPSTLSSWKMGAYTEYINMVSVNDGRRSLKALMTLPHYSSEFAEIVYAFDEATDLSAVNDITLSLMLTTVSGDTFDGYTVRVIVGGERFRCVSETTVKPTNSESFLLSLDISDIADRTDVHYIKICVQNSSGKNDEIITNVLGIDAHSNTHTNDQLAKIFAKKENPTLSDSVNDSETQWKILSVAAMLVISLIVIFALNIYCRSGIEDDDDTDSANPKSAAR